MNNIKIRLSVFFAFFIVGFIFASCSDSTSPEDGQGQIKITLVDSPGDYDQVNIVVTRVEVHKIESDSSSGWFVINNIPFTYDLLTLRNGASVVLGDRFLDAGNYSQIRLIIGTGSNVVVNGIVHPLDIPSGAQSGLKLNHQFEIKPDLLYELILDFDAEHSIHQTGNGQYKLKPVIRVVPLVISGTMSGSIQPATTLSYLYAINGTDTVGTIADPLTGYFKIMALLDRTYRVEVFSTNIAYNDTTLTNVVITAMQNTDIGTIELSVK